MVSADLASIRPCVQTPVLLPKKNKERKIFLLKTYLQKARPSGQSLRVVQKHIATELKEKSKERSSERHVEDTGT
jgi:hypothetical protein